jgi:putative peptidoglycan lipid II flippase
VAVRVSRALRRVAYFLVPSTLAYLALGDVMVAALFETGEFGPAESLVTWGVLAAYALGLPASGSSRVLSSAFYALRDTKTPARVAYLRVALSAGVGIALMFPADRLGFEGLRLGAAGLAMGASVGAWVEYALLRRALARRIGPHGAGGPSVARLALAAALAAASGAGLQLALPPAPPLLVAAETLVPFGVVFLVTAALLGEGGSRSRTTDA